MKTTLKIIAVSTAAALITASVPTKSYAEDHDWDTFGKVLTGVAAVGIVAALASHDYHADHCPMPPPPRCEPPRQWIPGHFEIRQEKICQPGHWDTVVVPAEYGWVRHGWHWQQVIVRPESTQQIWVPERYEVREVRVWVPGHNEVAQVQPYGDDHHRIEPPRSYDAPRSDNTPRPGDYPVPGRFKDPNRATEAPRENTYRN